TTDLGNDWKLYYGTSYRSPRLNSSSTYTIRISAVSGGRGAGLISPFGVKKPLIDLSNGITSYLDDYMDASGGGGYKRRVVVGSIINTDGTVPIASLAFSNFLGKVAEVTATAKCVSGTGGSRAEYKKFIVEEDGAGALVITELVNITKAGGNMAVTATSAGSTLTLNLATSIAANETFSYIIVINSDIDVASKFTVLYP
ncbi:hypothetical protein TI05_15435, partial [Achromatium sp. WMS3]